MLKNYEEVEKYLKANFSNVRTIETYKKGQYIWAEMDLNTDSDIIARNSDILLQGGFFQTKKADKIAFLWIPEHMKVWGKKGICQTTKEVSELCGEVQLRTSRKDRQKSKNN